MVKNLFFELFEQQPLWYFNAVRSLHSNTKVGVAQITKKNKFKLTLPKRYSCNFDKKRKLVIQGSRFCLSQKVLSIIIFIILLLF